MTDYRVRRERDEALEKVSEVERDLAIQIALFQKAVDIINQSCEDDSLTFDDFMYYWEKAVNSDEDVIVEQFGTLIMTAKIFFGEELNKIRVAESRALETQRKLFEKQNQERINRMEDYERLLEERTIERVKSIEYRKQLMRNIFLHHSTLDDLSDDDRIHAKALLESRNIRETYWLNRLIAITYDDVPPENDENYYQGRDHPGCPYSSRLGMYI